MCDDLTRQEILFFTVIQARPGGLSEDDIYSEMGALAQEMGWPEYLRSVPRPLHECLIEARDRSMIVKYQPLRWRPVPRLAAYVRYLAEEHLRNKEQRDKILAKLDVVVPAAG